MGSSEGCSIADATVTAVRAAGSSASTRSASTWDRVGGSVTDPSGDHPPRASSSANIGFPPVARASASSPGLEIRVGSTDERTLPSSVADSGPTGRRRRPGSQSPRPSGGEEPAVATSVRTATMTRTAEGATRRRAKPRTAAVGRSSHCASSTTSSSRPSALRVRRSSSTALDNACGSGGDVSAPRASADSSAARCGCGSASRASAGTGSNRSPSPAYGSSRSHSSGRARSTSSSAAAAWSSAARTIVVLPMPASPTIRRPVGPSAGSSRKRSTASSSRSRPTIDVDPLTVAA